MPKENVSVRLEPGNLSQVEAIAALMDRDRSYVINEAVAAYVELYHWQVDEIKKAVTEADAGDFATPEEVEALNSKYKP